MPRSEQDDKEDGGVRCFANYLLENMESAYGHQPEFDGSIGLAMEKMPHGVSRKSLWQISF